MAKRLAAKTAHVSLRPTVDSVVIHDIKNLAFRLSALLQNAENHFENPVFRTNLVETLGDTVHRMNTMVDSFRSHQSEVIIKLRIHVNELLRALIDSLPQGTVRRIRIVRDLADVPTVWGDSFFLQETFRSLIQNAVEAMPSGGTLTVRTRQAKLRRSSGVSVEITDTGVGMTRAFVQDQLFQPFATTKKNGMGLGLYSARQIVTLHKGTIRVRSKVDAGTTFQVVLPADSHA